MKKILPLALYICLSLQITSCKKAVDFDETLTVSNPSKNEIIPYDFDFETADLMPAPAGTSILSPWAFGANQQFPSAFIADKFESNGWVLIWNSFSPTGIIYPAHVVLYHKYRGVLRAFFYHPPTSPFASDYLVHSLSLLGHTNTNALNFAANEIADLGIADQTIVSQVQPYQSVQTGGWYAAEFEMAYDPDLGSYNAISTPFVWSVSTFDITEFIINGTSQTTITGTIEQPKSGPNLLNSFLKGVGSYFSEADIDNAQNLSTAIKETLKDASFPALLLNAGKSILSGIFGGGSGGGVYNVNLKAEAKYQFTGTMTNSALMTSPSLAIPGTANMSSVAGFVPRYQAPLGIFNVIGTPTVNGKYDMYDHGPPSGAITYFPHDFFLDPDSYEVVFNPSIFNSSPDGAVMENYKEEILLYDTIPGNLEIYEGIYPEEEINGHTVYILDTDEEIRQGYRSYNDGLYETAISNYYLRDSKRMTNEVLRITFDVVPNNGAPRVRIVKSFYLYCNPVLD